MPISATQYRINRLREQGRKAAYVRWSRERDRQDKLDALDPVRVGGRVVRRIVVIDHETRVLERTFYEFDRACDWSRKLREVVKSQMILAKSNSKC